jgi:DNA polymerase III subunit epsilon
MTVRLPLSPARWSRGRDWLRASFASLDFETTGLDYSRDHVVSFGVVPVRDGRAVVGRSVYQLVDPGAAPSPRSVTIHGVRARDLVGAPPTAQARDRLREALNGAFVLSWYAPVEIAFLARTFEGGRRRFARRTIDVRELAIELDRRRGSIGDSSDYALSACAHRYGVPVANPHDALDDALVAAQLFLVLATRMGSGEQPVRVRDLLRLTRFPLGGRARR